MNVPLIRNLRAPVSWLIAGGTALILFDVQYYLMANLPGERNLSCAVGANLTIGNVLFAALTSVLAGVFVAGLIPLIRSSGRASSVASAGIGATTLATLSAFCALCTLPVISVFGISLGLGFLGAYSLWFQLIAIVGFILALGLLNKRLRACSMRRSVL